MGATPLARPPVQEIGCTADWADLLHSGPVPHDTTRLYLASDPDLDVPPRLIECPPAALPEALKQERQQTRLMVVIDAAGAVLPAPVRVIEAPSLAHASAAVWVALQCPWTPGRVAGRAVWTVGMVPVRLATGDR